MSDTPKQPETADRLAKVIARAGLCSRRDAEGWIADGRISVNGKKVVTPAFNVTSKDKIEVDGLPLAARQGTRVWLYNKPAGLVVTEKDPEGRPTIFEALEEKGLPRILTVGRLDINTEGLLLLTNDGGLKRVLELPSTGWLRRYRVRAFGQVTQAQLDSLKNGITVEGVQYGPITATLEREQGANVWLVLGLREGKNREVKNVLGSLGLEVNRLIRISYGPFQLGDLAEGAVEAVKSRMLRDQLGKKLAESAGVDFESAIPDLPATPRSDLPVRSPRDRDLGRGNAGRGATRRPKSDTEERPMGRPRRVHFEDDGRAPEVYTPKGAGRGRPDRDDQPARSFGKPEGRKSFGDRLARSGDGDRPSRGSFGDRPKRDFGDRPQRAFGDKPARGARPDRGFEDRPKRSFGDKPSRGGFGDKPRSGGFEDRPKRAYGDKPARTGRPERSFEDRPKRDFNDRPKRSYGDAPTRGARPERGNEERPQRSGKPFGDRKPFAKRDGDAPRGGKSFGSAKPLGGKSFGSRPDGSRPEGGRPSNGRPSTGRPTSSRPTGGRPSNTRPSSGPRKPRG